MFLVRMPSPTSKGLNLFNQEGIIGEGDDDMTRRMDHLRFEFWPTRTLLLELRENG